jgi:hypothetical protein
MPRRLACALSVTALAIAAAPAVAANADSGAAVAPVATPTPSAAAARGADLPPGTAPVEPRAGRVTSFTANFSSKRGGSRTGVLLRTVGEPPEAPGTVAAAIRQTVAFPAGTRLRAGALPQCEATDAMLAEQGAEAVCPERSRVGSGRAEGLLAGTATVSFDLAVYAVRGKLFFAGQRAGMPLKQGFIGVPSGRKLVLTVPTMGGAIAPTLFEARIDAHAGSRAWLKTPERCPRSGHWVARGTFQGLTAPGGDPVGPSQRVRDTTPCIHSHGA